MEALPGQDGRDVVDGRLTLEAVLNAMHELSPEQQVLVALVCIDGASYKEAAEITNTPMLGAFARATGLFDMDELIEQVRAWFGKKLSTEAIEANVRALRRAAKEIQEG